MTDPQEVLQQFAQEVATEFPALREILDQAKAGLLGEAEALAALSEVVMSNPDLGRRFQALAYSALTPLRPEDAAKPLDHNRLVQHKDRGLPRLNPLIEAALIERAQFDDDMPELRTGGLPAGVRPAVSVETPVRDPVALGMMLNAASDQVAQRIQDQESHRRQLVADAALLDLVESSGSALVGRAEQDLVLAGKSDLVDVPEYRRGEVPAPLRVARPSGSALLALTPEERRQNAWKFLSTTQGRRSAINVIAELAQVKLAGEGFEVTVRDYDPGSTDTVLVAHEWKVGIDGPGAVQSTFNHIDLAATVLAKQLTSKMGDCRGRVVLEVTTVNTVDIRSVGWAGRLISADRALSPGDEPVKTGGPATSVEPESAAVDKVSNWTFEIRQGDSFTLTRKYHAPLCHDGRFTLWQMVGTLKEKNLLEQDLSRLHNPPRVKVYAEEENEEMLAIRNERLGRR